MNAFEKISYDFSRERHVLMIGFQLYKGCSSAFVIIND